MRFSGGPTRILKKILRKSYRIIFVLCKYNIRIPQKLWQLYVQKKESKYNFYNHKKKFSLSNSLKALATEVKKWRLGERTDV